MYFLDIKDMKKMKNPPVSYEFLNFVYFGNICVKFKEKFMFLIQNVS